MSEPRADKDIPLPERRSNRPVRFFHYIEYGAVRILLAFFRLLGVERASSFSGWVLRFLGPKLRRISRRAENNLRYVYPDWPDEKVMAVTKDVWENLGRTAAEFAHLDKFNANHPDGRVQVRGAENISDLLVNGGPAIFVTGHFANWETAAIAAHQAGLDFAIVYRPANNPLVDELIINERAAVMTRRQIPKGKHGSYLLYKAMRQGSVLALLVDQKLNDGIKVPFMGRDAMTTEAPARLALRYKLPVHPISIERLPKSRFLVTLNKAIEYESTDDPEADARSLTIKINETLERDIHARPGQWLWLHRRWPDVPKN